MEYQIYNEDCTSGADKIKEESIDLIICDPPFGINETSFHKHYNRNEKNVVKGYVEAPKDYYTFTKDWIGEAKRILKPNGSMYIISGWTNLNDILTAIKENNLIIINHIIWKFNFGVATKNKFVSSHYHILYVAKSNLNLYFNRFCRFGPNEKDEKGGSLNYRDMEDVWVINKEYCPDEIKNKNKLPEELIKKIIQYSSKENDIICDFFMGNFTTAIASIKLGRTPIGFELNKEAFDLGITKINNLNFGCDLQILKKIEVDLPKNQGKRITKEEKVKIQNDYTELTKNNKKKDAISSLCKTYGRGKFSIINIINKKEKKLNMVKSIKKQKKNNKIKKSRKSK